MDEQYFTPEGLEKLKSEYEHRISVLRGEIAKRLKEAKEEGDISENAGFDAAKEAQAVNEGRIEEIKDILDNAKVFKGSSGKSTVDIGSGVKVQSKNGTQDFVIVGAAESDPLRGFISNESPLGSAFLGKKKGDNVDVKTPKGIVEYKILEVK
ncbi:MAG: transcription elongation factor GreA [Candidatus Yanofskybacteria bacterium]|nr:transcription elongation factor GreA [Candidatus Yanofskybacteria bacterium]